jgi:hypothetical protein
MFPHDRMVNDWLEKPYHVESLLIKLK